MQKALQDFLSKWHNDFIEVHTSGSTGTPKRMLVEKERMLASARKTCDFFSLRRGDTALVCLPLDYIAGKMMVVRCIERGMNIITASPSQPSEGHPRADFVAMVPAQVYKLLQNDDDTAWLKSIPTVLLGGGPIDVELESRLRTFPNAVWSSYGMTETLSHVALRRLSGNEASDSYTPLDGVGISLNDKGCIVIDAPDVCAETLVTNDLGEMLPDGHFRILGRRDNTICSGGIKIQIEQVEEELRPILADTFCITHHKDPKLGEALALITTTDIPANAFDNLDRFHRPKTIIRTTNLPLTETGKICRKAAMNLANGAGSIVKYRLPGTTEIHELRGTISTYNAEIHRENGFIIAPFVGTPLFITPSESVDTSCDAHYYKPAQKSLSKDDYIHAFDTFHCALQSDEYRKLVLAHPFRADGINAEEAFQQMLQTYPNSFVYYISSPLTGTLIGATPEILLNVNNGKTRTMALAATKLAGEAWDDKSILEQNIVADYIADTLQTQGIDARRSKTYPMQAGKLQHLRTDFDFDVHETLMPINIAQALHPTPAVCGIPKDKALHFINDNEGFDRHFYAGYLGPVGTDELHLYVNIRCAELHSPHSATVYAGGGLLQASRMDDEWEELIRKRNSVINAYQ